MGTLTRLMNAVIVQPAARRYHTWRAHAHVCRSDFQKALYHVQKGGNPQRCLEEALKDDAPEAAQLFIEEGADPNGRCATRWYITDNMKDEYLIFGALRRGYPKCVEVLIANGALLDVVSKKLQNPADIVNEPSYMFAGTKNLIVQATTKVNQALGQAQPVRSLSSAP